jgi:hypothetical protein
LNSQWPHHPFLWDSQQNTHTKAFMSNLEFTEPSFVSNIYTGKNVVTLFKYKDLLPPWTFFILIVQLATATCLYKIIDVFSHLLCECGGQLEVDFCVRAIY